MSFPLIVVSLGGYDSMNPTGMLCYSDKSILAARMQLYLELGGFSVCCNAAVKRQELKTDADKKIRLLHDLRQSQSMVTLLR